MISQHEQHPRAVSDQLCWACETPLVPIGSGESRAAGDIGIQSWEWWQCPFCGLYIQIDQGGVGLLATRNPEEAHQGCSTTRWPDVFTPLIGTVVTFHAPARCPACQGLYPARCEVALIQEGIHLDCVEWQVRVNGTCPPSHRLVRLRTPCACDASTLQTTFATLARWLLTLPSETRLFWHEYHPAHAHLSQEVFSTPAQDWYTPAESLQLLEASSLAAYLHHLPIRVVFSPSAHWGSIYSHSSEANGQERLWGCYAESL